MFIYGIQPSDGALVWHRHRGFRDGANQWDGPTTIGSGWQGFNTVVASDDGAIYAIQPDGALLWYRHLRYRNSVEGNAAGDWSNGGNAVTVGNSWNAFRAVFAGPEGVIYAVQPDGTLLWYQHLGYRDGSNSWTNGSIPKQVGTGWRIGTGPQEFKSVFAGPLGAIYAVRNDGTLLWYRHRGYRDGTNVWSGPTAIGSDWNGFRTVFAGEEGAIYAVRPDGTLLWYQHIGYRDGSNTWANGGVPKQVGTGWAFKSVFVTKAVLEAYCTPLSVAPGETVSVRVSSPQRVAIDLVCFQREGAQHTPTAVTTAVQRTPSVQLVPARPWESGCSWTTTASLTVPSTEQSGIYAARCVGEDGRVFYASVVVRPKSTARGDFAVLANTNTWTAYNDWGGRSKYTIPPGAVLNVNRPNPAASPVDGGGLNHLTRAELWVLDWLRVARYKADVYTDSDFHAGIPGLSGYKALVLNTHPEYWTGQMLTLLQQYLSGGGRVLYLAGNGIFEEVTYPATPAGAIGFFPAGVALGRERSYFRNPRPNVRPPRPERAVLGVAYLANNYETFASLKVERASHRFFAGTGVYNGMVIGEDGLNGGASGWEMDASTAGNVTDNTTVVNAELDSDRGRAPDNLELLARGTNGRHAAEMTYYRHPGGGFVFAAGSLTFGGSLVVDSTLQQVVRNVLNECLQSTAAAAAPDAEPAPMLGD